MNNMKILIITVQGTILNALTALATGVVYFKVPQPLKI
jgi:hypothetical protein